MLYLVTIHATVERGLAIEAAGGPGPTFTHIVERFKPDLGLFHTRRALHIPGGRPRSREDGRAHGDRNPRFRRRAQIYSGAAALRGDERDRRSDAARRPGAQGWMRHGEGENKPRGHCRLQPTIRDSVLQRSDNKGKAA